MIEFFNLSPATSNSQITSLEKYLPITILFVALVLIYKYRNNLLQNPNLDKKIRTSLGITLFLFLSIYYIIEWNVNGILVSNLPLHLCFLSSILCTILCFNGNEFLGKVMIYTGVLGGLSSLLFPVIDLSWRYFRYYQFMVVHMLIIIIPIYFFIVYKYRILKYDLLKIFLIIELLGISLGIFNELFKTDYMFVSFSSNFAAQNSVLSTLGTEKNYFLNLQLLFFSVFVSWSLILIKLTKCLKFKNNY